jgi:uncharacterized protein (TIGR02145 family)
MGCLHGLEEKADGVCAAPSDVGCNNTTLNLGTVSFTSGTEITIIGDNISQFWSRPVTATGCQKTNFNSGSTVSANADCRSNPNYPGDLFSICAVLKYADKLCPYPWRIPTMKNYEDLVRAFGETQPVLNSESFVNKFVTGWAVAYAGECDPKSTLQFQNQRAIYILNASTPRETRRFQVCNKGDAQCYWSVQITPGQQYNHGWSLRCVRNN